MGSNSNVRNMTTKPLLEVFIDRQLNLRIKDNGSSVNAFVDGVVASAQPTSSRIPCTISTSAFDESTTSA